MRKFLIVTIAIIGFGIAANAQSPEDIARRFLTAFFQGDVPTMKSLSMSKDGADYKPSPYQNSIKCDKVQLTQDDRNRGIKTLKSATFKITSGDKYKSSLITVRLFVGSDKYGMAVWLGEINGTWKVTTFGDLNDSSY